jgi:hypothetical protein
MTNTIEKQKILTSEKQRQIKVYISKEESSPIGLNS